MRLPPCASASRSSRRPPLRRHSTCRSTTTITKAALETSYKSELPFIKPEDELLDALVGCSDAGAVDKAVKACLSSGGRPGCPAIVSAEKLQADMKKAKEAGEDMPKAKPRKADAGGMKPGWANQGEGRTVAKVHDNSV